MTTESVLLTVQLFGDASLRTTAGAEVGLSPLQLALVTLVYGHASGGLTRPRAIHLLWGGSATDRGRQRMRQLLLDTRRRVGGRIIGTAADLLQPLEEIGSDLEQFRAALQHGPLVTAARLIHRGFIGGATTTRLPKAFQDWRKGRASGLLRETRMRAFSTWAFASGRSDWTSAADAAEALYALDPDDATAVERVIGARGRLGNVVGAEEAYATYVASLQYGAVPVPEIELAIGRVRSIGRAKLTVVEASDHSVPFIGRGEALAAARKLMDTVEGGQFEMLMVAGESGIGKTRLLDEIHREAVLRGFRCARAQPVELERQIPLNTLLDALIQVDLEPYLNAIGEPWSSVVASLLPPGTLHDLPSSPPPIQARSLSRRLLDSLALIFERLAEEQPTLLLIDDFHWADATTVAALQFLQRRWSEGALGIFVTLRPELVGHDDPLTTYLMASSSLCVRQIELRTLQQRESLALVHAIAGDLIHDKEARRLCAIAGHHPLYLTELSRDFVSGRLALPDRTDGQVRIPKSLAHMLDARLEAMDTRAMHVAGVLAVAARSVRIGDVQVLASLSPQDTASAIETLSRARFVTIEGDRVSMAHELFRSAVYRHLSPLRRAIHHRAIANHLLANAREDSAGELSIHFARAGEDALAAHYGWIAARRASAAGAIAEAIQFLEVVEERETDPTRRADATAELANALHLSRDITQANPQLLVAAQRLRATGRPKHARRLEVKRIVGLAEVDAQPLEQLTRDLTRLKAEAQVEEDWESVALALDAELQLFHRRGDVEGIRSLLDEMRRVASKESVEAKLLARAGLALSVFFGDPKEALVAAREAVELAEEGRPYRLKALNRLLVVLHARGMLTAPEARGWVNEARALAAQSGDPLAHFCVESNIAVSYLDAGDVARAEILLARATKVAGPGEMHINRFIQANNEAELALAHQDYQTASQLFSRAACFLGPTTPTYMQDLVHAGLGYCALETGDLAEARRREKLLHPPPESWYFDPTTILSFRARLLERRGRAAEAAVLLEEAAADLKGRLTLAWMKVALMQVRLAAKHLPQEARSLAEHMGQWARELHLAHRAQEFEAVVARLDAKNR